MLSLLGPKAPERLPRPGSVETCDAGRALAHATSSSPEGSCGLPACVSSAPRVSGWGARAALSMRARSDSPPPATPELDPAAAEAARIAALEPRFGAEITADYFPMEVGLDGAIDYTKGCYLGQEPIVRIRDRGHINWRLVRLDLAGRRSPHRATRWRPTPSPRPGESPAPPAFPTAAASRWRCCT